MTNSEIDIHTNQRNIWDAEWDNLPSDMQTVPGHNSYVPSVGVVNFSDYVLQNGLCAKGDRLLDMGCGIGRNIPFLSRNFTVTGSDYSAEGLRKAKYELESIGVTPTLVEHDLTEGWPFQSQSFDVAIDSLTSASMYTRASRQRFVSELHRVLRPGGVVLMRAVSNQDETERQLMDSSPGPEPLSSMWPGSNKFQKNFSEDEIRELYNTFDIIVMQRELKQSAKKLGRVVTAINWWVVAQKPSEKEVS